MNKSNKAYFSKSDAYHSISQILDGSLEAHFNVLPEYACLANNIYLQEGRKTKRRFYHLDDWVKSPICFDDILIEHYAENDYLKGLVVEAYIKKESDYNLVTLAFRGTRTINWRDWVANFNWFSRWVQLRDNHYQQVEQCIGFYIAKIKASLKEDSSTPVAFVSTGHSLGGGLAQQAAYVSPDLKWVFAFNSSPVTGFFTTEKSQRKKNSEGLTIYSIEEKGDVLSFLRFWTFMLIQLKQNKNEAPQRHMLRFNFKHHESAISQHSMDDLTFSLVKNSEKLSDISIDIS